MRNELQTPLRRPLAAIWRALTAGLSYALGLLALVVEVPAFAPWTDEPR